MKRRSSHLAAVPALLAACLFNAAFMTLLAVGTGVLRLQEPSAHRAMVVDLQPPHLSRPKAGARSIAEPPRSPKTGVPASSKGLGPGKTAPASAYPSASRGALAPSPQAIEGEEAGLKAAAAVLRRLGDCAQLSSAKEVEPSRCELRRDATTPTISSIPAARRLEFEAAGRRADDLAATSRALQSQTFQPEGSRAARFGCNLSHGKWRCGSY